MWATVYSTILRQRPKEGHCERQGLEEDVVIRGSSCILKSLVKVILAPKTSKRRKHFYGRCPGKILISSWDWILLLM